LVDSRETRGLTHIRNPRYTAGMKPRTFVLTLFLFILATLLFITTSIFPSIAIAQSTENDLKQRMIDHINEYRRQHGCGALVVNEKLTASAQGHVQDMALNDFMGHVSSDGRTAMQRMADAGYTYLWVGENIAAWSPEPEYVVDRWYNETPPNDLHRKNLLNCAYKHVGVGHYLLENDPGKVRNKHYWALNLGNPSASELRNAPTPTATRTATATRTIPTVLPSATPTAAQMPTSPIASDCTGVPAPPGLFEPRDGTRLTLQSVWLDWSDVPCATYYLITLERNAPNTTRIDHLSQVNESEYMTRPLEVGVTYYWRVRSCNQWGCGARSLFQWFTVIPRTQP
jgi:uncharacterized protein YkwD